MKCIAVPPISKGTCKGCFFNHPKDTCNRPSSLKYPCIIRGEHINIYTKICFDRKRIKIL